MAVITDALPCHICLPVCLWIMDPHSRAPKKNTSHGNEVLPQDTMHLIQRSCYQRGSPRLGPAGNWTTRRPPDDHEEAQTALVWSCLPFIRSGLNYLARHSERGTKTRQTEEEVGRQHQEMDRPGVQQVPEGSGEQGKVEKTGCEIICGAPTAFAVKGLMMMRWESQDSVPKSPFWKERWTEAKWSLQINGENYLKKKQRKITTTWGGVFLACEDFWRRFSDSFPACTFLLLLLLNQVVVSWCALIPHFRLGSVRSGSVSWGNYGQAFYDELCVSSFSLIVSHTVPVQHSQPTPTSSGQGCMRV